MVRRRHPDVNAEPSRRACSLPFGFLSQRLAGEGLARARHSLSAVACRASDRHGLAAGSCDGGRRRGRCFASRGVTPERELPPRTNTQLPCNELPCAIEGVAELRVVGAVSFEHGQQALDARDRPADRVLAVFLRRGQIMQIFPQRPSPYSGPVLTTVESRCSPTASRPTPHRISPHMRIWPRATRPSAGRSR